MFNSAEILAKLVSMLMSWLDAANLRNRVYTQQQRIEQLELAIEDIERVNNHSDNPSELIKKLAARAKKNR